MLLRCALSLSLATFILASTYGDQSAADLASEIYESCLRKYSTSCIKPKALAWLSNAVHQDVIKITEDLEIIKTDEDDLTNSNDKRSSNNYIHLFDQIDSFLSTHVLRIGVPKILRDSDARSFIPEHYLHGGISEGLVVPLAEGKAAEGRGFVKKVMIPFLLGLKFKTTVLVPITLALIALKSWKAMTLGLLSLVLAGAMVIFKFAKPKIVNYEIVHYPHPHIPHPPPPPAHVHWEPPAGWAARSFDSQDIAYSAHTQENRV